MIDDPDQMLSILEIALERQCAGRQAGRQVQWAEYSEGNM